MDNFFSSLAKKTCVYGTIWADRKDYPSTLKNATPTTMDDFQTSIVNHENAVVWMDEKSVHFVNTYYQFDKVKSEEKAT